MRMDFKDMPIGTYFCSDMDWPDHSITYDLYVKENDNVGTIINKDGSSGNRVSMSTFRNLQTYPDLETGLKEVYKWNIMIVQVRNTNI